MPEQIRTIAELLARDRRYKFEAYAFVFEALSYAHNVMGLGGGPQQPPGEGAETGAIESGEPESQDTDDPQPERHITGQELCEAIRRYALEQYGYMAKCVLNSWGVYSTSDFGEIVFNLIEIGSMRKRPEDRREDFDDVFDFDVGLTESFSIQIPE